MAQTTAPSRVPPPPRDGTPAQAGRAPAATPADPLRQLLAAVPERPRLVDSIKLAGQMHESAFKDPPWLLERQDAGYIQVTRLLYLIAEACTGEHTLDEIAREVSEKSGRTISVDNVRQLVATQLLAKGLIPTADGRVVASAAASGRSALQINLRTRELPPRVLNPLTAVLKTLYWPPALALVLGVASFAEFWLYAVHGVGGGVHDALYKPGFMLVLLAIIVCSAGFHELGHAAALRYGGGQVRGMGAGMYLVYPAFYTDVSDNYRLPRWSRVRTDLGGFYFNMILALGIFGLYLLVHQEALLLVVTLINFEILHQLLPFLRLDGYWALADLTGVPDFFSQMGAFARSLVPGLRMKGRKLPALKWWARLIFGLYMLVTIPLLAFLLFVMVKSIPRVLATTWDALGQQVQQVSQALAEGNALGVLGGAGQGLLLMLPLIGMAFTLYRLGRSGVTLLYRWSRPTPLRRLVGSVAGIGVLALLVLLWAPQLPFGILGGRPGLAVSEASYTPIRQDERLTVGDALNDVVATRDAGPGTEPTPGPSATPTDGPPSDQIAIATASVVPESAAAPTPLAVGTLAGTPAPTPAAAIPTVGAASAPPGVSARATPAVATNPAGQATPVAGLATSPTGQATPVAGLATDPAGQPTPAAVSTTGPAGQATPVAVSANNPAGQATPVAVATNPAGQATPQPGAATLLPRPTSTSTPARAPTPPAPATR